MMLDELGRRQAAECGMGSEVVILETAIQIKRAKVVGRPVVQALRGSLTAHQAGLLIMSGRFVDNAVEEAAALGKIPIVPIDGRRFAELLLENQIGARKNSVTLYALALGDLALDALQGAPKTRASKAGRRPRSRP